MTNQDIFRIGKLYLECQLRPGDRLFLKNLETEGRPTAYKVNILIVAAGPAPGSGFAAVPHAGRCLPWTTRNADAVDSWILEGPLPRLVEQAVAFVRRNTPKPLLVKGLKRQNTETYPAEALREAVVNAVAHRDYSDAGAKIAIEVYADRLLVCSPGDPPGGQTADRLASGEARSRSRNPLIVQGLEWLELMDERGSGIPRMMRLMEQAGHPKPAYRIDDDSLVLEFQPAEGGSTERSAKRLPHPSTTAGSRPHGKRFCPRSGRQGRSRRESAYSGSVSRARLPNATLPNLSPKAFSKRRV